MPSVNPVTVVSQAGPTTIINAGNGTVRITVFGVRGPQGAPGGGAGTAPAISEDPNNRATLGSDGGVFVPDDFVPDPLAYYILAKA